MRLCQLSLFRVSETFTRPSRTLIDGAALNLTPVSKHHMLILICLPTHSFNCKYYCHPKDIPSKGRIELQKLCQDNMGGAVEYSGRPAQLSRKPQLRTAGSNFERRSLTPTNRCWNYFLRSSSLHFNTTLMLIVIDSRQ